MCAKLMDWRALGMKRYWTTVMATWFKHCRSCSKAISKVLFITENSYLVLLTLIELLASLFFLHTSPDTTTKKATKHCPFSEKELQLALFCSLKDSLSSFVLRFSFSQNIQGEETGSLGSQKRSVEGLILQSVNVK